MTLGDFRQSLTAAKPPAELALALAGLWWMLRVIGLGHTNPLSRTKAPADRGCTPICIASKAIRAMQRTGMVAQASLFADNHSMRNGSAL
jgi:hypothetical protein